LTCAWGAAQDLGHLVDRQVIDEPQHENRALAGRHTPQRRAQGIVVMRFGQQVRLLVQVG
jgi:hypothetical protein